MQRQLEVQHLLRSETFLVAALLAVAGGFLDAYTYLCRGGVFANAETGNLVLLAVQLTEGNWTKAAHYFVPILAYSMGILTVELVKKHHHSAGRFHWRQMMLLLEMLALLATSFVPLGRWDRAVNVTVAFVCAVQVETFRKVRGNPFASTMCTGNLRSGMESLFHGIWNRDSERIGKSACYFGVICCFLLGASLGVLVSGRTPQRAVLIPVALQFAVFLLLYDEQRLENAQMHSVA